MDPELSLRKIFTAPKDKGGRCVFVSALLPGLRHCFVSRPSSMCVQTFAGDGHSFILITGAGTHFLAFSPNNQISSKAFDRGVYCAQLRLVMTFCLSLLRRDPLTMIVLDEMDALLESGQLQATLCTLFEWPKRESSARVEACDVFTSPQSNRNASLEHRSGTLSKRREAT